MHYPPDHRANNIDKCFVSYRAGIYRCAIHSRDFASQPRMKGDENPRDDLRFIDLFVRYSDQLFTFNWHPQLYPIHN